MKSIITNFLSWFKKLNKRTLSLVFGFLILGMALPFHSVQAFAIIATLTSYAIATVVLNAAAAFSYAILWFASLILAWVTSPHFISVSYTTNDFVMLGWTLTRDLSNMFFIIVLVVIGLATALRKGDYGAKKALPLLIIIALLINFTLVITGFIIDASNIIMRFFLAEGTGLDLLVAQLNATKGPLASLLNDFEWKNVFATSVLTLVTPLFLIMFNILSTFIILLFAALFAMRYVALWMLVILSPIAFLFYILPSTRKYFNQWWDQFIQWCLIGITAAFFLYLSNQLTAIIGNNNFVIEPSGFLDILTPIMPFVIVLGFLVIGFFATLSISASGTTQIISFGKKGSSLAGKFASNRGKAWAKEKIPEEIKRMGDRLAKAKPPKIGEGRFAKFQDPFTKTSWAVKRTLGKGIVGIVETERADADKAAKDAKSRSEAGNIATLRGITTTPAERAGILSTMIEIGQTKGAIESFTDGKEIIEAYKKVVNMKDKNKLETIARGMGKDYNQKVEEFARERGIFTKEDKDKYVSYANMILRKANTADKMKQLHPDWYKNKEAMETIHKFGTSHQVGEAAKTIGRDFVEEFQKTAKLKNNGEIDIDWYAKNNPQLLRYLWGGGAADSGLTLPGLDEIEKEYLGKIIKKEKIKTPKELAKRQSVLKRKINDFSFAINGLEKKLSTPETFSSKLQPIKEKELEKMKQEKIQINEEFKNIGKKIKELKIKKAEKQKEAKEQEITETVEPKTEIDKLNEKAQKGAEEIEELKKKL